MSFVTRFIIRIHYSYLQVLHHARLAYPARVSAWCESLYAAYGRESAKSLTQRDLRFAPGGSLIASFRRGLAPPLAQLPPLICFALCVGHRGVVEGGLSDFLALCEGNQKVLHIRAHIAN